MSVVEPMTYGLSTLSRAIVAPTTVSVAVSSASSLLLTVVDRSVGHTSMSTSSLSSSVVSIEPVAAPPSIVSSATT
jgi:hypothetical protein